MIYLSSSLEHIKWSMYSIKKSFTEFSWLNFECHLPSPYPQSSYTNLKFHMPLITNDAVVFGLLISILAIFLLLQVVKIQIGKILHLCSISFALLFHPVHFYLIGIIDPKNPIYTIWLQDICCLQFSSTNVKHNIKGILNLGWKAVAMFFAGTAGIIIGPLALIVSAINPEITAGAGPDEVWRGLATVAGSWIGGGTNQTAMFEIFEASDTLFSAMITVDIIVANIWIALFFTVQE